MRRTCLCGSIGVVGLDRLCFPLAEYTNHANRSAVGAAYLSGYSVIDVSDPETPIVIGAPPTAQLGLQAPVTTGSGLLVATTTPLGPNPQQVALYDVSQPTDVTQFLTLFDTPGEARALTIHNGLAYVADSAAGVQVVNYLAYDSQGMPPAIQLSTSATNGEAEASQPFRVTAEATDDVQVRHVEFYVDGVEVFSDGNFPFELRFTLLVFVRFIGTNNSLEATGNDFWELRPKLSDVRGHAVNVKRHDCPHLVWAWRD